MKKIGFVTFSGSPEISLDDTILAEALETHQIKGMPAPWDDPAVDWTDFDLLLIRSCWNYHLNPEKFQSWIDTIIASGVKMANPAELILWNLNKYYLKELKDKGVAMPDSVWISEQNFYADKLHDILAEKKWNRAVLKPCISAGSFRTTIITPLTAREEGEALSQNFIKGGMILQEFMDTIQKSGELSIIFFSSEFSHAIIKQAMRGEFRVQHQFGGKSKPIVVKKEIVKSAQRIVEKLPVVPLYARVDGFECDGEFRLMELELIELVLFFKNLPDAAKKFVSHLVKLL